MRKLLKNKLPYALIILAFLTVNVFAPLSMMSWKHHEMSMSDCPFMIGGTALCQMNVFEHLASWQAMFTVLPVEFSYFVLLLLALVLSWVWLRNIFDPPDTSQQQSHFSYGSDIHSLSFAALLLESAISPRAP